MRPVALLFVVASSALTCALSHVALAACQASSPCADAEPMWQTPSAVHLNVVSDTAALALGQLGLGAAATLRFSPAALNVPAPNERGRDVNLIKTALSWSLTGRVGIGNRMELTALAAGLSQQGAGIKGVTSQNGPPIDSPSLQDPRVGFGYSLTSSASFGAKVRFEAKLPLGNVEAFAGEPSFVASPSLALSSARGRFFGGLELGARLRRPSDFFGVRIGSQASIAAGLGYEFPGARLSFALEVYLLPSLIDTGRASYLPSEWLYSTRLAPRCFGNFSLGVGAGGGLPLVGAVGGAQLGFGVPAFRGLVFVRMTPAAP